MTFKVVRTDSAEALKIKLPIGRLILGRGSFFNIKNITDKRVSLNHAELEVTNDSVTIKSLHENPCYYIKKNSGEMEILKQNDSVTLGNGDKFGILPEKYWYELIYCALDDTQTTTGRSQNTVDKDTEKTEIEKTADNADKADGSLSEEVERSASPSVIASNQPQEADGNQSQTLLDEQPPSPKTVKRLNSVENDDDSNKRIKTEPPDDVRPEIADPVTEDESAGTAVKLEAVDAQVESSNNEAGGVNKDNNEDNKNVTAVSSPVAHQEELVFTNYYDVDSPCMSPL